MQEVEESVKARTKGEAGAAKTLCMPFEQDTLPMVSNTLAEGTFLLLILLEFASNFQLILHMRLQNLGLADTVVLGGNLRN